MTLTLRLSLSLSLSLFVSLSLGASAQQKAARRPLSPTRVSPRRSDGADGWGDGDEMHRPQSPPRQPQETDQSHARHTSPRRRRAAGGGRAAVSALRQPDTSARGVDSALADSVQMLGTSQLGSQAYGSGVFERSVAELHYSASVAEVFANESHAAHHPNTEASATLRRRPHSAAAGLPGGYTAVNGTAVASSGLPLHVQQGQQAPAAISLSRIDMSSSFRGMPQSQSHLDLHVTGRGSINTTRGSVRDGDLKRRSKRESSAGSGGARRGSASGRGGGKAHSLAVQRAEAMKRYHRDVL